MPKVILLNIPSSGHVNPTLPVITALRDTDIEVIYVSGAENQATVEATETRFISYPDYLPTVNEFFQDVRTDNFAQNAIALLKIGNEVLPYVLDLIEQEKPDFIMHDSLAAWGKIAARVTGLPVVCFISTFVLDNKFAGKVMPLKTQLMMLPQIAATLPAFFRERGKVRRTYNVEPPSLFDPLMAMEDHNIVFTSVEFQPNGKHYADRCRFVGPIIGKRPAATDFPFEILHNDRPNVYISMGTIAKNHAFIRRCFDAFGSMEAGFILSVGKQTDINTLGDIPGNFHVYNFVPQVALLPRVDAFLTHGGMNSVHEGLIAGVPLVCVPQQQEQAMVAAQLGMTGAGIPLQLVPPFGDVGAAQLREAVETILSDTSYAQKSAALGESMRAAGGVSRVVNLLQAFAREGRFPVE